MARNTIKGLTVEIGGDTTKLGKALESVNKKSSDLSSELGNINRLLKLDPGNTELLAQKQKVLADAVANTREKLNTLKEAERQVQAQFEKGEASEEQVRAIRQEIISTTKKMEGYEKAAKETAAAVDKLGKSDVGKLTQKIEKQRQTLEQLKAKHKEVAQSQGNTSKEATDLGKKIEKLNGQIEKNEKKLSDAEKAAEDAAGGLDKMADSADKAEKSSGEMGAKMGEAAKAGLAAVAAMATAAVAGLTAAAESSREYRTAMGKLDTAFTQAGFSSGAATGAYKELQGVLGDTDQAVEAANHLSQLTTNEKDLATWTGDILPGVFATFGDSLPIEGLTEAANETAKVGQVTGPLADALNWAGVSEDEFNASLAACSDEQERQALIMDTLSGLYGEASEAYKETNAEVIRANQANEAWMEQMAAVGGTVEPLITDVKMLGASLLSEAVPGVQALTTAMRGVLSGDEGAAAGLGSVLSGMVTDLLAKVTELAPTVVQVAVTLITSLATSIVSMVPTLLSTVMQLATIILTGISEAIPQLAQAITEMIPQLAQALADGLPVMLSAAVNLLLSLVSAVGQILPVLVQTLPQIVTTIITSLLSQVPMLLQGAIQLLLAVVQAIPVLVTSLAEQLPIIVQTIIDTLIQGIPILIQGATQLLLSIIDAIPVVIQALIPMIPQIISSIVQMYIQAGPTLFAAALDLLLSIVRAIPDLVVELLKAVPQIYMGVAQGLLDGVGVLKETVKTFCDNIVNSFKNFLGIHSPSTVMAEIGNFLVQGLVNMLKKLPSGVQDIIKKVLSSIISWGADMARKAKETGQNFISGVVNFFQNLPSRVASILTSALSRVTSWATDMRAKAVTAAKNVLTAVVNGLKALPSKLASIGGDLVTGLWNGLNNKLAWLKSKIKSFTSSVLGSIKSFFGVNSPSKETAWIGDMLDQGLAKGILDHMRDPVAAMGEVAGGVLAAAQAPDGLALDRQIQTAGSAAAAAASAPDATLLGKLDKILSAIEAGQVIALDGKKLVGETFRQYDAKLGQQRDLAVRGAV